MKEYYTTNWPDEYVPGYDQTPEQANKEIMMLRQMVNDLERDVEWHSKQRQENTSRFIKSTLKMKRDLQVEICNLSGEIHRLRAIIKNNNTASHDDLSALQDGESDKHASSGGE